MKDQNATNKKSEFFDLNSMSDMDVENFVRYLVGILRSTVYMDFFQIYGERLMTFLNLFQGKSVKFPKVGLLNKYKFYVRVYTYIELRGFTPEAYRGHDRR